MMTAVDSMDIYVYIEVKRPCNRSQNRSNVDSRRQYNNSHLNPIQNHIHTPPPPNER